MLEMMCVDPSLFGRLADLGIAMQAHQALDRRNGFHKHNMGAALGLAAPELSPDEVAFFRATRFADDSARHVLVLVALLCKLCSCVGVESRSYVVV